jgi:hypothetical protein
LWCALVTGRALRGAPHPISFDHPWSEAPSCPSLARWPTAGVFQQPRTFCHELTGACLRKLKYMTDTPDFTPAPVPSEAELLSFDSRDVPSAFKIEGDPLRHFPSEMPMGGLSEQMRARVEAKLANVAPGDRDRLSPGFIKEEMELASDAFKVLAGPGENATAVQREAYGIRREVFDLERQIARATEEMDEITGYTTELASDGTPVPVPTYRLAPETRRGRQEWIDGLKYQLSQVQREKPRRLAEAAQEEREKIAASNEQFEIEAKARAMAPDIRKQAEIKRRAEAYARHGRDYT